MNDRSPPRNAAESALAEVDATAALAESEARLAAAIEIAALGYYEAAKGGRIAFMDQRARGLLAIGPGEDHRARDIWVQRLHPDDRERVLEQAGDILAGGLDRSAIQYRYLHPTLGLLWLDHVSRAVARDASGTMTRSIGVVKDITDRKQSEARLRDMAERYDAIMSTTTDGFWELDGLGKIVDVNDEACRMYGYRREELLGLSVADFETRQAPSEIRQTIARVKERGEMRFETRHRGRDGGLLDIEVSTTYRQSTGTFLVFLRDATARTKGERQLQESLEFSRTILASLVDRIVILDRRGAIIAINSAWEQLALESGGPEVLRRVGGGVNYLDVCDRAAAREVRAGIESVLSGGSGFYRFEYSSDTPKETLWYLMDVMPFRRAEGGAVVVHRDITARRRAEEELQRLRQDIWHAQRVAQTGAIAASLAHELNQPLTAILSNAQAGARLMTRPNVDLDEIRAILADIVHDDNRAAGVIVGLRAMLRRQATQRERIDLARTIQDVLALTGNELLAQEVVVELRAPSECVLWADRVQIQQVVLNLVMNAIEAMEDLPSEQRRLEISLTTTPAREAQLAVRDRGPGIAEDVQSKVFDSFWTTKPKGMGIGLPISRSIIESHGGHLWFANNEDRGVTFFLSLPLRSDRGSA